MKKNRFTLILLIFILSLAVFIPNNVSAEPKTLFKDIPNDFWAKKEIEYLVNNKIISGYGDGTFKPDASISRKHAAALLVRALNIRTSNRNNPNYTDVTTNHAYYNEIAAVTAEGLFKIQGNLFKPDQSIINPSRNGICFSKSI
jgi:hypothetical protein